MGIILQFELDKSLSEEHKWGLKALSKLLGKPLQK